MSAPRQYPGVMVSSTFEDLKEHRAALMSAIQGQQLHAVAMESDSARPVDLIESSLEKVREAAAYIVIISRRYGSTPSCAANPAGLSLTHLEFREAVKLGLPILIFIMGPRHLVTEDGVELDQDKRAKLAAFREEAKLAGGAVHRVYKEFNDLADFATAATQSVAELRRVLEGPAPRPEPRSDGIPAAPALYAQPRYLGSHEFVGRKAQLTTLSDWAGPADPHTVLLFEAIGGTGKSILTWEWITRHASGVRGDWAGMFWYSFYEAGAVMTDFSCRALAYMTGRPLADFTGKKQLELTDLLVRELASRPWLLVLDGLERVLVAYHRIDAAQVRDEEAGGFGDVSRRDPCSAIRPDDENLLRHLAGVAPSKVLITSRLMPKVLLNHARQAIPGVLHERLSGLRPADAEALLRSCGVTGDSAAMRSYLQRHCDCHPLVTGIVAGLINDYLPARGSFDRWSADVQHGGGLEVGQLDLVQKRNHILHVALSALPATGRQLLSTLAMLSQAVGYPTLSALSPDTDDLAATVTDLERRGLLQYDRQSRNYDLHPVVRAVAASSLATAEKQVLGQRVVDHFSAKATGRYPKTISFAELQGDLTVVRTLLQMGDLQAAYHAFSDDLEAALTDWLEALPETLSLLKPFFSEGWTRAAESLGAVERDYLMSVVGDVLYRLDEHDEALTVAFAQLELGLAVSSPDSVVVCLGGLAVTLDQLNQMVRYRRAAQLCLELSTVVDDVLLHRMGRSVAFGWLATVGEVDEAEEERAHIDRLDGPADDIVSDQIWRRRCDDALTFLELQVAMGAAAEHEFMEAEAIAAQRGFRSMVRRARYLRGTWLTGQGRWAEAVHVLGEAVSMAREVGIHDSEAETWLALARWHTARLPAPREEAAELAERPYPAHLPLGRLWFAIGDLARATEHALAAYRHAWADGEPYARMYDLRNAERLLNELGVEIPVLPPYDPAKHPKEPWEHEVEALIAELRAAKS